MSSHEEQLRKFGDLMFEAGKAGTPLEQAFSETYSKCPITFRGSVEYGVVPGIGAVDNSEVSEVVNRYEAGLAEYRRNRPFGIDSNLLT